MTSVSAGHIILTPTQPVGSGRPQRESNPGPHHQELRAISEVAGAGGGGKEGRAGAGKEGRIEARKE